jgi:hypothetical protein
MVRPPDSLIDKFSYQFETFVGKIDAENVEYYLLNGRSEL